MKLKDVSKLEKITIQYQRSIYDHGRVAGYNACIEKLENQPEVKAIPLEFIERKLAEHWYVNYDIRELLDDWDKENENI